MRRITDEDLQNRIKKRKAELDALLGLEQQRLQTRRSKLGEYLEVKYGIKTVAELEQLLSNLSNREEV